MSLQSITPSLYPSPRVEYSDPWGLLTFCWRTNPLTLSSSTVSFNQTSWPYKILSSYHFSWCPTFSFTLPNSFSSPSFAVSYRISGWTLFWPLNQPVTPFLEVTWTERIKDPFKWDLNFFRKTSFWVLRLRKKKKRSIIIHRFWDKSCINLSNRGHETWGYCGT